MSGRVPYTKEQQQWLIANAELMSVQSMADQLGRTEKSVRSFFNKRGIPTRKDLYSAEEIKFIEDNAGKMSWIEIAEKLGKSHDAIKTWASRKGISGSFSHSRSSQLFETQTCEGLFCEKEFKPNRARQKFCSDGCTKSIYRLSKYGISKEQWWNFYCQQQGKCVCGSVLIKSIKTRGDVCVDHDHSCCPGKNSCGNCVRGLLCSKCNFALGLVKDDSELLVKLADYVNSRKKLSDS